MSATMPTPNLFQQGNAVAATNPKQTQDPIKWLQWAILGLYGIVWFISTSQLFQSDFLVHAGLVTAVYLGFHYYEMNYRGHALLSADSTAVMVLPVILLSALAHFQLGLWVVETEDRSQFLLNFATAHLVAWMGAHILAVLVGITGEKIMAMLKS